MAIATARQVLLDSAAYLALANPQDAHHVQARQTLDRLTRERWFPLTTNFVVAEAHALLLSRLGYEPAAAFLRHFGRSATRVVRVVPADEARARAIIYEYDDKDFSLTDALSFAVMERLRVAVAFTYDRHFAQFGWALAEPR